MKLITFFSLLLTFCHSVAFACENKGPNIILFTWDGVRTQEFFKGVDPILRNQLPESEPESIFKSLWSNQSKQSVIFGATQQYQIASHVSVSLPSYQALFTGHANSCRDNHCGKIQENTFLETIAQTLKLPAKDVAAFASWEGLKSAVAKDASLITEVIYPEITSFSKDPVLMNLQNQAMKDLPTWLESRKDQYTFEMGMHYLKNYCPRILYISLVDSDEYGHNGDYPGYVQSLRTYDSYLERIIQTLNQLGDYGKQTTLIVTTDHSRGDGLKWTNHGSEDPVEKNVFLFMSGRGVIPAGLTNKSATHANIRPSIEYLMGIKPTGSVLPHLSVQ